MQQPGVTYWVPICLIPLTDLSLSGGGCGSITAPGRPRSRPQLVPFVSQH
jgi:hypothetical protein